MNKESYQHIQDLLLTELDTFTDEELQYVTIAVTVNGTTYAIDSLEYETIGELIAAIEKQDFYQIEENNYNEKD